MPNTKEGPNEGYNSAVARQLRAERAAQGLSIPELARRSGVPISSLERYLGEKTSITLANFHKVAAGLGLSMETILRRAEERLESGE